MFKRKLIPVWMGIIALSSVFLIGQETWPPTGEFADVQNVSVTGSPGAYTFAVTVRSPDRGCNQYADWWEVLTTEGDLVYRRILLHSHVLQQPFTREGEPVPVQPHETVIVRAHMNTLGYGGAAVRGTVETGFEPAPDITADFAPEVENQEPLPEYCLY